MPRPLWTWRSCENRAVFPLWTNHVSLLSWVISTYIPLNTRVLHLGSLTFRNLTFWHSLQVSISFSVLKVSISVFLCHFVVSLPGFLALGPLPYLVLAPPNLHPKFRSLLPFIQSGQSVFCSGVLVIVDLVIFLLFFFLLPLLLFIKLLLYVWNFSKSFTHFAS